MNDDGEAGELRRLSFFATPPHSCSYLPEREAITLFADPAAHPDRRLYSTLSDYGFRRSGRYIYRPACPGCRECVPVRIPVERFRPRRSQRRCTRINADLVVEMRPARFREEEYRLYQRYIEARHPGGGMETDSPEQYMAFLTSDWSETRFVAFREPSGRLLMVAVVDRLERGYSAVYTFYEPTERSRGLGTWAVLWEIELCRREALPWLYLGYWIEDSRKMRYKAEFRPQERFHEGRWRMVE